jgi:hypothetical protein
MSTSTIDTWARASWEMPAAKRACFTTPPNAEATSASGFGAQTQVVAEGLAGTCQQSPNAGREPVHDGDLTRRRRLG